MSNIFLVILALSPAVFLMSYIFKKDKVEKEPKILLFILFMAGVIICFPAADIEKFLYEILFSITENFGYYEGDALKLTTPLFLLFKGVDAFIGVALVEEGLKWLVLLFVTAKNKNFNCLFDGVVYSVFVSLGFAAFENILYVLDNGISNAVGRAITAVPGHFFNAVIMGFFFSWWKVYLKADKFELKYQLKSEKENRKIRPDVFKPRKYLLLSLIMPVLAHGFYDFCLFVDMSAFTIIFYVYLAFLYFYCFKKVVRFSQQDTNISALAKHYFYKNYPEVDIEDVGIRVDVDSMIPMPQMTFASVNAYYPPGAKLFSFPNGDEFIGFMEDGYLTGYGVYYFADGGKYEGEFELSKLCGFGTFTNSNGESYVGFWNDNKCNGSGTYFSSNGSSVSGYWEDGKLIREVIV